MHCMNAKVYTNWFLILCEMTLCEAITLIHSRGVTAVLKKNPNEKQRYDVIG